MPAIVFSAALGREATVDLQAVYRRNIAILGINTIPMDASDCAAILERLTPLFESGSLEPFSPTDRVLLSEAPRAYAELDAGRAGKYVLLPDA